MTNKQVYEKYWSLTLEYSNINGEKFITTLRTIVQFIDDHPALKDNYDSRLYAKLQKILSKIYKKVDSASSRKSINQFVKLGFIYPKLSGYPSLTKKFIRADNDDARKLIISEVIYRYSSFNSSVTKDDRKNRQVNFLLKTLMHHPDKQINSSELTALMTVDISLYRKGYLTKKELESRVNFSKSIGFESRKYNQKNYLFNYLKYIPGIYVNNSKTLISYTEDDSILIKSDLKLTRDETLFRIMKENIKQESINFYGDVVCYLTKKPQKGLIVSHIWPLQEALNKRDISSAYDPNNALILEPNVDAYFDKNDLTFNENGYPLFNTTTVYDEFIKSHKHLKIDNCILNESRLYYLKKHNDNFNDKLNK